MADYVIPSHTVSGDRITMGGADTLLVEQGASLSVTANAQAVRFTTPTDGAVITNFGTIEALGDAGDPRAIRFESGIGDTLNATITNASSGSIYARSDAIQIQAGTLAAGLLTIDNAGSIRSLQSQALDLANSTGTFTVELDNSGTISAEADDAIRFGSIGNVTNEGRIDGGSVDTYSGADGLQYEVNATGTVTNNSGGTIIGDRHGINAGIGSVITVLNSVGGTLEGRNGSGVGSDGTATITNYGSIIGSFSNSVGSDKNGTTVGELDGGGPDGINDGDGDGIDVDGKATILNGGLIHGVSAGGSGSDGLFNTAEGIAAGGGSIDNLAAGIIRGGGLGILIDDSSQGNAFFLTTVDNKGLIEGLTGTGIRIVSLLADVIVNDGTIKGGNGFAIQFGAGDNRLVIKDGSAMTGIADGQGGVNTLDYRVFGTGGTVVKLATGAATGTGGIDNFVNLLGSAGVDNFAGSAAAELLDGNNGADVLSGGAGNDRLFGDEGNDLLNGGADLDAMAGGLGNDGYSVDNAGDRVTEAFDGGIDRVSSSINHILAANVENLTLVGTAGSGSGNILANTITGNAGDNKLDGKGGADRLVGGAGNDGYVVDSSGDRVIEAVAGGTDRVSSSVTHRLAANVENLALTGNEAIDGAGNGDRNGITGNAANNRISGGGGKDVLTGGAGADQFRFDTALDPVNNWDDILDFSVTDDVIVLDRTIFTGIGTNGTLASSAFVAGTSALDASDRIVFDTATGRIFYDVDGFGGAAQVLIARVDINTPLTHLDFFAVA
ncbi:MAG TPA: calcium-binding protein [Allosphingosinicella sp.]|jgi:hypothetical protein